MRIWSKGWDTFRCEISCLEFQPSSCFGRLWETHTACTERHVSDLRLLTSQESPVYWGGQEQRSTVYAGPPVPVVVASSKPTSPRLSRWLWVKYRARILRPIRSDRTLISSSLETGPLVMAWRQFPCNLQNDKSLTQRVALHQTTDLKWVGGF